MLQEGSRGHHRSRSGERFLNGLSTLKRRLSNSKRPQDKDDARSPRSTLVEAGLKIGLAPPMSVSLAQKEMVSRFMAMFGQEVELQSPADSSDSSSSIPEIQVTSSDPLNSNHSRDSLPPENVFDFKAPTSGTIRLQPDNARVEENVLTICAFTKNGESLQMRTLLDTGMEPNVMREGIAKETGYDIRPCNGEVLLTANGDEFRPIGKVTLRWHFWRRGNERTYGCEFLVIPDRCPYDVVLGFPFISAADLFQWNLHAFVLVDKRKNKEEQLKREQREKEKREHNKRQVEEDRKRRQQKHSSDNKEWRNS